MIYLIGVWVFGGCGVKVENEGKMACGDRLLSRWSPHRGLVGYASQAVPTPFTISSGQQRSGEAYRAVLLVIYFA